MIKWTIFDLGGIVVPESNHRICKEISKILNIEESQYVELKKDFGNELSTGRITLSEFYSVIITMLGSKIEPRKLLQKHLELYGKHSSIWCDCILRLIDDLRMKCKIACLTNTEVEIAEFNRERSLFSHFDKSFVSADVGMKKPDSDIFEYVISTLKCQPEKLLFIDDKRENIEPARQLGIHCIHYESAEQFISAIEQYEFESMNN